MTTKTTPTHRDPVQSTPGHHAIGHPVQRTDRGLDHSVDAVLTSDRNA